MCGRFVITSSPDDLRRLLAYLEQPNFPPRYNIAPTQPIPVVRQEHGARHFALARWGLIPSWVKDPKTFALLLNARLEGINDKPSYGAAMRRRRCLIPADGFYEWKKEGKGKRPFLIRARSRAPFAFAGLWETWTDRDGGAVDTAAIVTCAANETLAPLHERMPVIVPEDKFEAWLDCDRVDAKQAAALVGKAPDDFLDVVEVSPIVNSVKNDSEENLAPVP
jgi:putative SOS response-associated peptidase YedK